ncbi:DHA2 family efflux MFS transporter permease subunit [Virgibacillus oceani]|uniref:MFS transporter n=1 Tax=Virgibacillus oceani TaxID=1479511 RepID=A0A917H9N4_9BACI|nr:DHA2 family efflux MFS transporter permease subunit [Virgibacillus oceani]GGG72477.1 MFS transporter [Virgibacillus oceani]
MKHPINKKILMPVMLLGSFLSILNQTILNVALPDLMNEFEIGATTVQWLITGFMLVNGILVPVTAFLMKRFTTRQLFLSSMAFLFAGTFISAIAPGFEFLLVGRLIQAAGAGIIMPLLMTVVFVVYPKEGRGTAMGFIGLAMIVAPAIGPTLAGFVIEQFSWRWIFIGMLPLVAIVILLSLKFLVNVSETSKAKLDLTSIILSTIGFGGLLFGLSNAGDKGWGSAEVLIFIALGIVLLFLFCRRQIMSKDPLLNLSVFKVPMFTTTTIISVMVMFVMYADMILLPIYLQTSRGFSVLDTALLLLPGALVNALLSPVTGRILDKFGPKPIVIVGLCFLIPSIWGVTHLTDATTYNYLMIRTVFLRIGLSFLTMPLNTAGLNALPNHLNSHGSAVTNTVRQLAGSIGTAMIITIFTSRTNSHAAQMVDTNQALSPSQLAQKSSILGTNDAYLFMLVLGIIALVVTVFMRKERSSEQEEAIEVKKMKQPAEGR